MTEVSLSGRCGEYVNFMSEYEPNRIRSAYGPKLERLAAIKATYDPDNIFRGNAKTSPQPGPLSNNVPRRTRHDGSAWWTQLLTALTESRTWGGGRTVEHHRTLPQLSGVLLPCRRLGERLAGTGGR